MAPITPSASTDLSARRKITLEPPEFLLCALEHRLSEASATPATEAPLTLEHLVEWVVWRGNR